MNEHCFQVLVYLTVSAFNVTLMCHANNTVARLWPGRINGLILLLLGDFLDQLRYYVLHVYVAIQCKDNMKINGK